MTTIAAAMVAVLGLFAYLVVRAAGGIAAAETVGWLEALSRSIVKSAADRIPAEQRERELEEALADLEALEGRPAARVLAAVRYVWGVGALRVELARTVPVQPSNKTAHTVSAPSIGEPRRVGAAVVAGLDALHHTLSRARHAIATARTAPSTILPVLGTVTRTASAVTRTAFAVGRDVVKGLIVTIHDLGRALNAGLSGTVPDRRRERALDVLLASSASGVLAVLLGQDIAKFALGAAVAVLTGSPVVSRSRSRR